MQPLGGDLLHLIYEKFQFDAACAQSGIHGLGVFAVSAIQRGQCLDRYEGQRLDQEQIDAVDWDYSLTYLFGLSNSTVIDGSRDGNGFQHLNHSCNPSQCTLPRSQVRCAVV